MSGSSSERVTAAQTLAVTSVVLLHWTYPLQNVAHVPVPSQARCCPGDSWSEQRSSSSDSANGGDYAFFSAFRAYADVGDGACVCGVDVGAGGVSLKKNVFDVSAVSASCGGDACDALCFCNVSRWSTLLLLCFELLQTKSSLREQWMIFWMKSMKLARLKKMWCKKQKCSLLLSKQTSYNSVSRWMNSFLSTYASLCGGVYAFCGVCVSFELFFGGDSALQLFVLVLNRTKTQNMRKIQETAWIVCAQSLHSCQI